MKKYITFILILCILCQCALFSISTNAEEIISGDIQTEEMQFATLEEVLAGLATPDQLPPAYDAFKPQNGQYTTLSSSTGLNFDGIYYINNAYGGVFLTCPTSTSVVPDGRKGLKSTLGNTTKWMISEVEDGSGIYTIRPMIAYSKYLAFSSRNVYATLSSTLNDYSKWYISTAAHGGAVIQNVGISRYLQSYGDTSFDGTADINVIPNLPSGTSANYNSYAWRIVNHLAYTELDTNFSIETLQLLDGGEMAPTINKSPAGAYWVDATDFYYTYNTLYLSYDSITGKFTDISPGTTMQSVTVIAEHKVTGLSKTFTVVSRPLPIFLGIQTGEHDHLSCLQNIRPYFAQLGYGSNSTIYHGGFSISQVDSFLDTDTNSFFITRSHGGKIEFQDGTQAGTYFVINYSSDNKVNYLSTGSISELDLSNMDLMLFVSCKSGLGGEDSPNLPSVAVAQGARTAVGFEGVIGCGSANEWTEELFELMSSGLSLKVACDQLSSKSKYIEYGLANTVICGYKYITLTNIR